MAVIVLTDRCNLSCPTCFRPPRRRGASRSWSFAELQECLDQLAAIGQSSAGYTGGEPGLWCDGGVGIGDLLAATARRGLLPMVVTNGYLFRDEASTAAFFDAYFASTDVPLHVHVSVDHWHEGAWQDGRSRALETALRWRDAQQTRPALVLGIVSLWCLDESQNTRAEEFAPYVAAGVGLQYLPLSPWGSPADLDWLAPKLHPTGTEKSTLGSYGEILRRSMGLSPQEWTALDNAHLLGTCQAVDMLTLDLGGDWWLCNDRAGRSMRVAAGGGLDSEAIADCLARNPLVARLRERGVATALRDCQEGAGLIDAATAASILTQPHPYGISGRAACGLCRSLPDDVFSSSQGV